MNNDNNYIKVSDIGNIIVAFGQFIQANKLESQVDNNKSIYLTTNEVIEKYPFTKSTLYNAFRYKGLKSHKLGKKRVFKLDDIQEYIDGLSVEKEKIDIFK